jgi:alkylhydroperoxidase family enzyme
VPDEVIDEARGQFSDDEIARLVYAIAAINVWNRLNVVGQKPVGDYRPGQLQTA